jgi:hypothetical protein
MQTNLADEAAEDFAASGKLCLHFGIRVDTSRRRTIARAVQDELNGDPDRHAKWRRGGANESFAGKGEQATQEQADDAPDIFSLE